MKEKTIGEALGITKEREKKFMASARKIVTKEKNQNVASVIKIFCEEENLDKKSVLAGWYLLSIAMELTEIETIAKIDLYSNFNEQIKEFGFIPI